MKQDSVLFQCFFIDYTFYYTKQSYLFLYLRMQILYATVRVS
jgi:hypothetical protein